MKTLMKCGHVVHHDKSDAPLCPSCIGINIDAEIPENMNEIRLEGRSAKCRYCNNVVKSNLDLPFFTYQEEKDKDRFYCGCKGWD